MEGDDRYSEYGDKDERIEAGSKYFKFSVEGARAIDIFYYFEYWDEGVSVDDRR